MESSIKINSISIDLADGTDGIDAGKCEHFSIRGFVAEIRERDYRKCWPFSEESVELRDHESFCLPALPVRKSRWWRCPSCIKDINDTDCRLQPQVRSVKERKLDAGSSAIPSKREQNSLTVTDKKEKKTDVQTVKLLKKVRRRGKDASKVKSKSSKLASPEQASKKAVNGAEAAMEAATAYGPFEVAGVVDDTPDKTIKKSDRYSHRDEECDNASPVRRNLLGPNNRRKTRKVRLLSELLSNRNKEESPSKKESVRGRKRKSCEDQEEPDETTNYASRILSTIGKTSENASKSCDDSEENTVSGAEESRPSVESHESTDSGFDKEVAIKGKQRNRRFQVVEETSTKDPYDYVSPVRSSFPVKDLVPCPLHTQRTEKDLSVAKKRKRKADKNSTIINFGNSMDDGKNLVKQRKPDTFPQAFSRNPMPQSTRDFLNSKWLDCSYPQLDDRPPPVFPLPLRERMHFKEEDHRAMLKGLGTNHFRNFGSSFKSTSGDDGCLRSGVNVNFSSNGNAIRYASSTEVAGSSCALQKQDNYPAQTKGKEVAVQELPGASRIQSKASEQIDDIPMEIVELMAKNQYERCLPDREEDKQPTTSVSKNALLIDLNETYDNTMDNTSRPPNPLGNNARNSDLLTGKPNSLDLFSTSQFGQPYTVPSGFGIPPLTRDNQSSSIQFPGLVGQSSHNCHWLGNATTAMATQQNSPFRVLRACNTCQSVQQQQFREPSHPVWPPSITSPQHVHQPLSLSLPQKFVEQSTKLDNPNTRNLNFEGVSSKPVDTYSNESSIPAMHLLSLMDPRLRSNIPTDTKFVKPTFSPVNQSKEFIGPQQREYSKAAYATKHWPFDLYSRRVVTTPETSRESFAVIPPVGSSSFALQGEKSSAENVDFTLQASWNQEKKSKRKDNNFAPIFNNNNSHHQKPIFASSSGSDIGKFQLLGASDSMMLPLKFHMKDNAKKQKTKKAQSYSTVSACPPTSTSGPFVCSFNRNPADFTIPNAPGNVYMLKGDDFKVRKHAVSKKKPSLCKQDALMQNKNSSLAPEAENA